MLTICKQYFDQFIFNKSKGLFMTDPGSLSLLAFEMNQLHSATCVFQAHFITQTLFDVILLNSYEVNRKYRQTV